VNAAGVGGVDWGGGFWREGFCEDLFESAGFGVVEGAGLCVAYRWEMLVFVKSEGR
jgi:hypothetical protein